MRGTFDNEIRAAIAKKAAPKGPKKGFPPKKSAPMNDGDAEDMIDGGVDEAQEDASGRKIAKKGVAPFKSNRPNGFKPK